MAPVKAESQRRRLCMAGMFGDNPLSVLITVGLVVLAAVVFALMTAGF